MLHADRLFPTDPASLAIARRLHAAIKDLPIVSPHGHTDARWFAENHPFPDPATLFIKPDHYVFRMLYSQGVPMESLGIGQEKIEDPRAVWKIFAKHYYLFRGTPTRLWMNYAFQELFGLEPLLSAETADLYYDTIQEKLSTPEFLPRALFERFRLEVLATTDSPLDDLRFHRQLAESNWQGRIIPTFRPDAVVDPDFDGFTNNVEQLGIQTKEDTSRWSGYLAALRKSRERFRSLGCTATDHGHPTPATADLSREAAESLFDRVRSGTASAAEAELFRAQMLTEMAAMSVEDGLVMQIHPGSMRNHNAEIYRRFGRDVGADIPTATDYVHNLQPLLRRFGNEPKLTIILFTLDESSYSRELAPLAGHYPILKLGPAWWFHDSPEGMLRFREYTTETAGFYNTVGFNDDTRAFLSIPARHDVARRVDCAYLAKLVADHRLEEEEAQEVALDLAYRLAVSTYRLTKHG
ncbi:MAG TPA: glucuronate isomerase [Acidobacteriaceae bacterium]|jgi:glucuronate isomerase|nr:glucuronate isomerase [Acidobacteriaceae bacterium]